MVTQEVLNGSVANFYRRADNSRKHHCMRRKKKKNNHYHESFDRSSPVYSPPRHLHINSNAYAISFNNEAERKKPSSVD